MANERIEYDWQHTSFILAQIANLFGKKNGGSFSPDELNPLKADKIGYIRRGAPLTKDWLRMIAKEHPKRGQKSEIKAKSGE